MKIKFCFIVFVLLITKFYSVNSQTLSLKDQKIDTKLNLFFIDKVDSFNGNFGNGYFGTNEKRPIILKDGLANSLFSLLPANNSALKTAVGINIKIDDLKFEEKLLKGGREVSGEGKMTLSSFDVKNPEKSFYKTIGHITYTRPNNGESIHFFEKNIVSLFDICLKYLNNYVNTDKKNIAPFANGTLIQILPYQTKNYGDTVNYKSRKISWADFNGSPGNSSYSAAIYPNMALNTKIGIKDGKFFAEIQPKVFMLKSMSWSKKQLETEYALKHEQLHFDVVYCIMEELKKTLMALKADSIDDLSSKIQYEYLQAYNKMNKIQQSYDDETEHSQNRESQADWERKIRSHMP